MPPHINAILGLRELVILPWIGKSEKGLAGFL
jgi:hypothetical protein